MSYEEKDPAWMRWLIAHINKRVGLWTVLGLSERRSHRLRFARVQCQCGALHDVQINSMRRGESSGCASCRAKESHPKLTEQEKRKRFARDLQRIAEAIAAIEGKQRKQAKKRGKPRKKAGGQ